ncbi:DUF7159 family protein, partial [Mycolicibacterium vanbaalenii]|uniref:DUF7159 family protein n=1 Tax=Mycolicibacterium vanbaalenii TaxID=110539 RepID=UPI0021F3559A
MDLVLGLSMTASSIRWVLVDGATGEESVTIDRGSVPVDDAFQADALLDRLLGRPVHAIGLTWTVEAERTASAVWQGLTDRGVENVIAVSDVESAEALACGIADLAGCERVVVGLAEPGTSVIAAVTPDGVTADRVDPAALTDVDGFDPSRSSCSAPATSPAWCRARAAQHGPRRLRRRGRPCPGQGSGAGVGLRGVDPRRPGRTRPAQAVPDGHAGLGAGHGGRDVRRVPVGGVGDDADARQPGPADGACGDGADPEPVEKPVVKPAPVKAAPPEPEAAPPPPAAPPVAEPV